MMKLGIIGTGRIASRFVSELNEKQGFPSELEIQLSAIFNLHPGSAEKFVQQHLSEDDPVRATDNLDDFFRLCDAVYIASPHETHIGYIHDALRAGKHVLCEKPMSLDRETLAEEFRYADGHGLILMEAVKTAYCPGFMKLEELVGSGVIGEVKNVEACFTKIESPCSRELIDTEFGGSFTELGSYVTFPVFRFLGTDLSDVRFDSINADNGLDIFTRISLEYGDALATLTCGLGAKSDGRLLLGGTEGYFIVPAPWWLPKKIERYDINGGLVKAYETRFEGNGLRYEIMEFTLRVFDKMLELLKPEQRKSLAPSEGRPTGVMPMESLKMAEMMERFLSNNRKS